MKTPHRETPQARSNRQVKALQLLLAFATGERDYDAVEEAMRIAGMVPTVRRKPTAEQLAELRDIAHAALLGQA